MSPSKQKKVVLFYMDGCPHCEIMMPEWDVFEKNHDNVSKIERKSIPQHLQEQIVSFPTIVMMKNDNIIKRHQGLRVAKSFEAFLKSSIPREKTKRNYGRSRKSRSLRIKRIHY